MKSDTIDFIKIVKQGYKIIIKNKYLWLLGLLAGAGDAGLSNSGYSLSGTDFNNFRDFEPFKNINSNSFQNLGAQGGKILGAETGMGITAWLLVSILALAIIILMIYLSTTARGAIISSVAKIDSGENSNLANAWKLGHKYFWKIFLISIFYALIILVPVSVLAGIIVALVLLHMNITALIFGILFFLCLFIFLFYFSLVIPYSERILVLENSSPYNALIAGFKFFNKNWKNVLIMYLAVLVVGIGVSFALAVSLGVILIVLVPIGVMFYYLSHILLWFYAIPVSLLLFAALLIASGIIQSYNSALYTLTYKEIQGQKTVF